MAGGGEDGVQRVLGMLLLLLPKKKLLEREEVDRKMVFQDSLLSILSCLLQQKLKWWLFSPVSA